MTKQSRTGNRVDQEPVPARRLPFVNLLVDTRGDLMTLVVNTGVQVLGALLEDERTRLCGPRYHHGADRQATRAGTTPSEVVLGVKRQGKLTPLRH
jgi:hypothetical protein